jgi:hypothetical protein
MGITMATVAIVGPIIQVIIATRATIRFGLAAAIMAIVGTISRVSIPSRAMRTTNPIMRIILVFVSGARTLRVIALGVVTLRIVAPRVVVVPVIMPVRSTSTAGGTAGAKEVFKREVHLA